MTEFTKEVVAVIKKIPKGKVMTYGQIATWAGNPWGARQVVRILNSMSQTYELPWHRVINAKGGISLKDEGGAMQKRKLLEEGVVFDNDLINLSVYRFEADI